MRAGRLPLQPKQDRIMSELSRVILAAAAFTAVTLSSIAASAQSPTPSPAGASVYIINPKDGDTLTSPFRVQFGLTGMGVAPAGVEKPNTGHHHLIIDTKLTDEEMKAPIPGDAKHVHFGGGQTEAMVTLPPGTHTLQLVLGDWSHIPHSPPVMSTPITITVK
jgi:hypothetical protein